MRMQHIAVKLAVCIALGVVVLDAPGAAFSRSSCDRVCLKGFVDGYLDAVVAHDPTRVPLAAAYKATFNGQQGPLQGEVWQNIERFAFHQYVYDTAAGEVAFYGVAQQSNNRGTFFLRLKVLDGKLAEIETVAGARTVDGVPGLISPNPLFDYVLPRSQRRSRAQLTAIANLYFEGLQRHDGKDVPVSLDCRRFEDGVQTSLNPVFLPLACNDLSPFTYMDKTKQRFYPVVDAERGLVLGEMVIEVSTPRGPPSGARSTVNPATGMIMPPNPMRSMPRDTIIRELFKVIDGKIVEIQTVRLDMPYLSGGGW